MASRQNLASANAATAAVQAWSRPLRRHSLVIVPTGPSERDYQRRLGQAIVQLRVLRNISQARLAELLERSEAALSRWENGKATPTAWDLRRMCEILDAPADLLAFPPDAPVSPVAEALTRRVEEGGRRGLSENGHERGVA